MSASALLGSTRASGNDGVEGQRHKPFTRNSHLSFQNPRPMTPTLLSFRFGSHNDAPRSRWSSESNGTRGGRRASTQSIPTDKGKGPARVEGEDYAHPVWSSHGYGIMDRDPFASPGAAAPSHSSYNAPSSSRPSAPSASPSTSSKGSRGSIFMAASDALGFKFGRRRHSIRQPPSPIVLPDVIEITARKRDEEEEERNRLRAEAAQAIGLDPLLVDPDAQSRLNTTDEEDEEDEELRQKESNNAQNLTDSQHYPGNVRNSAYTPHTTTPLHGSSTSIPMPVGRYRSGSLMGHSRTSSVNLTPIPTYPSTVSSLSQWQQHSGTLPKYYHPSSLRIFALSNSKNWKARYIMLTSPAAIITRTKTPAVSYVHLFKGSGPDEKELERLAINEDSVVFVSDDEVGGRRHVVKIGGVEAGAFKRELNYEESGRTMWFLQIEDPAESQQWISIIKNSILNQRAIRAGLMPATATSFGVNEPRGDIDVMLSMRAQGFITSPSNSNARQYLSASPSTVAQAENSYAPSISEHSVRTQASSPKASIAVSTIKTLFSGSRPRSASRATSVDTTKLQQQHDSNEDRDTFSSMGNNLMSMLRSTTPDVQSQSSGATVVRTNSPFLPSVTPDIGIDRKIFPDRQSLQLVANDPPASPSGTSRGTRALSPGSLQPPPRKRWTSSAVTPDVNQTSHQPAPEVYQNAQYNGTTGSLGALTYYKDHQEPGSPTHTTGSMTGISENQPRPPSLQSVSTYGSNENSLSFDRSSTSTKRTNSSRKRWSRPGSLPPRISSSSGPTTNPPASSSRLLLTGDTNRPASRASSAISTQSQQSVISSLPSFSKRASVSSVGTSSSHHSHSANGHTIGRPGLGPHRASMPPPPRPAPTSALPPAPGQRDHDRPRSVDSLPNPGSSPSKTKRASIAGRGFRLSMIAPSKPPPSSDLPPRPDEVEYGQALSGTSSAVSSRLSRLNPIPASPDPGDAPFPPPRGPLPPTPAEGNTDNNNRPSTNVSRHTSLKQRLRIRSAPSPPQSSSTPSTNGPDNANVNHNPMSALSNISNRNINVYNINGYTNTTADSHTHTRSNSSFTPRLSGSGFRHARTSSTGNSTPPMDSFLSLTNNTRNAKNHDNRASVPPPLTSTPSYLSMINSYSQPTTPIGEKIMSFQNESSFLNLTTPVSPLDPPPSSSPPPHISIPIRPLPAIPVAQEITSLSPPPRRNSKHLVVVERPPSHSLPRTPTTPSIFEEKLETESKLDSQPEPPSEPIIPTDAFGPSTSLSPPDPQKQLPLLLSLPPSPSLQPTLEERSATSLDSPAYEAHRMSPSRSASVLSLGMGL